MSCILRNPYAIKAWFIAALIAVTGSGPDATGQVVDRGIRDISMGTEYVVGFPEVRTATGEKPSPVPHVLYISSPYKATVSIKTLAASNDAAPIDSTVSLKPDSVLVYSVPLSYMHDESGVTEGYGIQVTADVPISVSSYQSWDGNAELVRYMPSSQYGTEYRTVNTFLDRFGLDIQGYKYRPSQMLLINNGERASVTIVSRIPLEVGPDLVESGVSGTYTASLGPYETMLVLWAVDEDQLKDWSSDPTGTLVTSTSPIGVVSGALKNATMRMPDVLPPIGPFKAGAHFVRNMMLENVPPTKRGGTEFITIPFQYTNVRNLIGESSIDLGVDNDSGDVVRVVALEDGTTVERKGLAQEQWQTLTVINAGESYLDTVCSGVYQWRTSSPSQVWQYGKSFARVLRAEIDKTNGANVQGHPTVEAGLPQLTQVPPTSQYVTHGSLYAPYGVDNYVNVVFRSSDADEIEFDGRVLSDVFANHIQEIEGTEWSFFAQEVGIGDHTIDAVADSVLFMAWTYGSLDGLTMGQAYSSPIGVDGADGTKDSVEIFLTDDNSCLVQELSVEAIIYQEYTARIAMVYPTELENVRIQRNIEGSLNHHLSIEQIDPQLDGRATLEVVMTNGHHYRVLFEFTSQFLISEETTFDVGVVDADSSECRTITVTNETQDSLTVSSIAANELGSGITVSETAFVLQPSESKDLELCVQPGEIGEYVDTLEFLGTCDNDLGKIELTYERATPQIFDADVEVPVVNGTLPVVTTIVELKVGALPVVIDSITTTDARFAAEPLDYPVVVDGGGTFRFEVLYETDGNEYDSLSTEVYVHYNHRTSERAAARIVFQRVTSVDEDQAPQQQIKIAPHPIGLSDGGSTLIELPRAGMTLEVRDMAGRIVWTSEVGGFTVELPTTAFNASGVYVLTARDASGTLQQTITAVH